MRRNTARGFSLIEILVTVFIIGLMAVISYAFLTTIQLSQSSENQTLALSIAADKVESLRALGYVSLPASGPFSDIALTALPSGTAALTVSDFNAKTKSVSVTVSWIEKETVKSVQLSTLITQVGGLP